MLFRSEAQRGGGGARTCRRGAWFSNGLYASFGGHFAAKHAALCVGREPVEVA